MLLFRSTLLPTNKGIIEECLSTMRHPHLRLTKTKSEGDSLRESDTDMPSTR